MLLVYDGKEELMEAVNKIKTNKRITENDIKDNL
jgi:hypothetical protein